MKCNELFAPVLDSQCVVVEECDHKIVYRDHKGNRTIIRYVDEPIVFSEMVKTHEMLKGLGFTKYWIIRTGMLNYGHHPTFLYNRSQKCNTILRDYEYLGIVPDYSVVLYADLGLIHIVCDTTKCVLEAVSSILTGKCISSLEQKVTMIRDLVVEKSDRTYQEYQTWMAQQKLLDADTKDAFLDLSKEHIDRWVGK
ncbi:hypothetical protein [Bacteroides sp.]|uniref:hypothetical protein n=1 Tax=Bacteroides sp. TaxID=29523 RepID=UPI00261303E1|nr:hypothetical protein [Bacteroides sp.]MDD3039024.1 hypothetical protein [Bacteroides sp.]